MREQLEALSKQIENLKEVAFTNKEHLDFSDGNLTEWEIEKIKESQKLTNEITSYSLVQEYEKVKKLTKYIRYGYILSFIIVLLWIIAIANDYISIKVENQSVQKIQTAKKNAEQKVLTLTSELEQNKEKINTLTALVKQKDIQIENIKKVLDEDKKEEKDNTATFSGIENIPDYKQNYTNPILSTPEVFWNTHIPLPIPTPTTTTTKTGEILSQTGSNSNSWIIKPEVGEIKTEEKVCKASISLTINVRDKAGLEGKVLWFLNEKTQIQVLQKTVFNGKNWYQISSDEMSGWISSVGIADFDSSCLK